MWGGSSLWFWFAFPWWLVILSILSCACWLSVYLLWKNVYSDPLPIFKLACFYDVDLYEFFVYFWILTPMEYIIYKYLLSFSRVTFCLIYSLLHYSFFFLFSSFALFPLVWWLYLELRLDPFLFCGGMYYGFVFLVILRFIWACSVASVVSSSLGPHRL